MLLEDDDVVKRPSLSIIPMLLLCMQMLTPLAVGKTNAPSKSDGPNPAYMYFIEKVCDGEGDIVATVLGNMGQTVQLNNDNYYAFNARDYSAASSRQVTYRLGAI